MVSESLITGSFKSEKIVHSSTKPTPSDLPGEGPKQCPWTSKTPEKPAELARRSRNQGSTQSIKEIREEAANLRNADQNSSDGPDPLMSAAKQRIGSLSDETPVAELNEASELINLPEKYEMLEKFFNSLDSSIRLLELKGFMSTLTNISPKIECLTHRSFSHNHIAQLKFILPEAIEIKKVLLLDERTNCMRPDLHVTLNADAIENDGMLKSNGGNLFLRKIFRSRLLDFFKSHPEVDDVPGETLPEPFNKSKHVLDTYIIKLSNSSLSGEASTDVFSGPESSSALSHLPRSFQRRFSQKILPEEAMDTKQEPSIVSAQTSALKISEPTLKSFHSEETPPIKPSSKSSNIDECLKLGPSSEVLKPSDPVVAAMKGVSSTKHEVSIEASIERTPFKNSSTPAKQPPTPANLPSAKISESCYMSSDEDDSIISPKFVGRPPRNRSLKFNTPVEDAEVEEEIHEHRMPSVDGDILDMLPENIQQSIRDDQSKALEKSDPAIFQAERRQKMTAGLPKFFDMVDFSFRSRNYSALTKEELMYLIIANYSEIECRREVKEQLSLLIELVPEWIQEQSVLSGDLIICINKKSSPESVRAKLVEAK